MKKLISILLMLSLLIGAASATYTAVSATGSLDARNDYATAPGTWTTLATGSNVNFIAYDAKYDYIVLTNITVVGTSPKFNIIHGDNPPAFRSDIGNLAYSVTNLTVQLWGPLEPARFLNSSGYFQFSTTNVTTGKIAVLKVIRR